MRGQACAVVLFLALGPATAAAQSRPVASGDRIRVWTEDAANTQLRSKPVRGELTFWTADTIRILADRTLSDRAIALTSVTRVDVSAGRASRGRSAVRAGGIGLLLGGLTGTVIGYASGDDPPGWFSSSAEEKAAIFGILLGGTSTIVGGVIGAIRPGERWERVPLPSREMAAPAR